MLKKIKFIATENVITIIYNGKRIAFNKEGKEEQFNSIKEMIRNGEDNKIIKKVFGKALIIPEYSKGLFKIDEERGIIVDVETNTNVSTFLSKRIIQWAKDNFPFEPLLQFHRKVIKNPSEESAKDLYEFLEKNFIPITTNGNFIAYKKIKIINDKYVDCYTGEIDNSIGQTVTIPREEVNANRKETCSTGLHVCGYSYLSSFGGDLVVEVEVDPMDVVSVPIDYNQAKMRVCRYKVLSKCENEREEHYLDTEETYKSKQTEPLEALKTEIETIPFKDATEKNWEGMTAQEIKDYIKKNYNIYITTANKNKKSIINKANKIIG